MALEINRLNRGHTDILQASQMGQITLAERHKETNTLDSFDILCQRFKFFMMQEIHILRPDLSEIIDTFDLHRLRLDPCAVLPIAPLR